MSITQAQRRFAVKSPLGEDILILSSLRWSERLGRVFRGTVHLLSADDNIDAEKILGKSLGVRFDINEPCSLQGLVSEFTRRGQEGGYTSYTAEVVPWFDLLRHAGGTRMFQQKSAIDIFKMLADEHGYSDKIDDRLTGDYEPREYCVQYRESDFHFLSRLLEEEGVYYFFEYGDDTHQLVLADDVSAHAELASGGQVSYAESDNLARPARMFGWEVTRRLGTDSVVLNDYDFEKPRAALRVRQNGESANTDAVWYQYPGRYQETSLGEQLARQQMEAAASGQQYATLATNLTGVRCGCRFTLAEHPVDAVNQEYIVRGCVVEASASLAQPGFQQADAFDCRLEVHASTQVFRSERGFVKPPAAGPHLGTVVGNDDEEIWTDSYGRVKVQFAWDLDGQSDDSSSCWIRVTQPWTGKGYGAISIPRVGEEVVVQFVDGDIDRPIVTGRVHNADRMPPEALPDSQAKTIFRTRSTKGGDVDAFHELTFDDTKDAESIYMHSERDFTRVVENNDSLKVGFDKQDAGNQTIEVYNDQSIEVGVGSGGGSQTVKIAQDRTVEVQQGNDTLTVQSGDIQTEATAGNIAQTAGQTITLEATESITLKCGDSQIEITPSGIKLAGTQINLQGQAKVAVQAPEVSTLADGQLKLGGNTQVSMQTGGVMQIKGAMVQIN